MAQSMTSFARGDREIQNHTLHCEIRSVNQRYLDAVIRLPDTARSCEPDLRDLLRKRVHRGKVECVIRLQSGGNKVQGWEINQPLLERLIRDVQFIASLSTTAKNPDPLELLKWPGVLMEEEIPAALLGEEILSLFQETLDRLIEARQREGEQLKQFIEDRLAEIDPIVDRVRQLMPDIKAASRTRIITLLQEVSDAPDQSRLEQELVYLAQKADIDEELDRLQTHTREVRRVLSSEGAIGRRLDFLMQELNREANTLSSKSIASATSLNSVELKVLIEQMREQVQNIE